MTEQITVERNADTGQLAKEPPPVFGADAVERSQGYEPMGPSEPWKPREEEQNTFKSDQSGLKDTAAELVQRRSEEAPQQEPKPRVYHNIVADEEGKLVFGAESEPNKTVTAERAAADLANARRGEDASAVEDDINFAQMVDAVRRGEDPTAVPVQPQPQQQAAPVEQQPAQAPEPQYTPQLRAAEEQQIKEFAAQHGVDENFARAYRDTPQQIRDTFAAAINQQAAQNVQQAIESTARLVGAATAAFPELSAARNLQDVDTIIKATSASSPQRAQQMQAHMKLAIDEGQKAVAAYQHQQQMAVQQTWQAVAHTDTQFEDAMVKRDGRATYDRVQAALPELIREQGLDPAAVYQRWATDPGMHDPHVQWAIYTAAKHELALRSAKPAKVPYRAPMKPGVASDVGARDDYAMAGAMRALDEKQDVKSATAALIARRKLTASRNRQ